MIRLNRKAQSTLEYALIVAVVVGALLAMQIYIKRGLQGRYRSSVDNIGEQYAAGRTTSKWVISETKSVNLDRAGYDGQGISNSSVTTAGTMTRTNQGADAAQEHVLDNLGTEALYHDDMTTDRLYTNDR
jgi:hypothetical protein